MEEGNEGKHGLDLAIPQLVVLALALLLLEKALMKRLEAKPQLRQRLAASAYRRSLLVVLERAGRVAAAPALEQLPRSWWSNRRVTPGRPQALLRS